MNQVTIWTLESDYDRDTVKCLANKLVAYLQLGTVRVRVVGKSAIPRAKDQRNPAEVLKHAVELYLQEDHCVIFVIDTDGPMARHERELQPNSLYNQVKRIISDSQFTQRVYLAQAVREIEAWLLIDCLGICCYFASKRFKEDCRARVAETQEFDKLIRKFQKGDTESIVEVEIGGEGVKEYLVRFSEAILLVVNPKLKDKDIKSKRYEEALSPKIAEHIRGQRNDITKK